uniref:Uncharacterized protein n=1 Tax=Mycena chlorophos TaxID=658473 RepID=A0ABQ0KXA6_MYCCL|nr:predicted protein [Mycena chlorophos]
MQSAPAPPAPSPPVRRTGYHNTAADAAWQYDSPIPERYNTGPPLPLVESSPTSRWGSGDRTDRSRHQWDSVESTAQSRGPSDPQGYSPSSGGVAPASWQSSSPSVPAPPADYRYGPPQGYYNSSPGRGAPPTYPYSPLASPDYSQPGAPYYPSNGNHRARRPRRSGNSSGPASSDSDPNADQSGPSSGR